MPAGSAPGQHRQPLGAGQQRDSIASHSEWHTYWRQLRGQTNHNQGHIPHLRSTVIRGQTHHNRGRIPHLRSTVICGQLHPNHGQIPHLHFNRINLVKFCTSRNRSQISTHNALYKTIPSVHRTTTMPPAGMTTVCRIVTNRSKPLPFETVTCLSQRSCYYYLRLVLAVNIKRDFPMYLDVSPP